MILIVLEDKRKEMENSCAEQFADMDRKLNDAKREHAKAGITCCQIRYSLPLFVLFLSS